MISRKRYSQEFKEKIGRELCLSQSSFPEVCKREGISITTLKKWRDRFGFGENVNQTENRELNDLRRQISTYEGAFGDMALQIHLLKKLHLYAGEQKRKRDLSGTISPSSMESKKVAGELK